MSIVCPLPSCYLIIVSVAPAVSPSLPSFVSLYSSPCVCSPVLIRCLSCRKGVSEDESKKTVLTVKEQEDALKGFFLAA